MRHLPTLTLAAIVFAIGCGDHPTTAPDAPRTPRFDISDGAHDNGNDGFFFLPPMVKEPVTNLKYKDEPFHGGMRPRIEICELATATQCATGEPFKRFAPDEISVGNQQYQVNWDTKEKPLVDGKKYRVQVFVGNVSLGWADVEHAENRAELKNLDTDEFVPLVDGRTLPIKFRIESGALCEFNTVCTSTFVDKDIGGTFYAADGGSAIDFSPGVLPVDVVVTIERIPILPGAQCVTHPSVARVVFLQFEGCYRITTTPDIAAFGGFQGPTEANPNVRAIVAVCIEPDVPDELHENLVLHKFDADGDPELQRPEPIQPPFDFPCDGFTGTSLGAGAFKGLVRDAWGVFASAFTRLLGPRPLYAVDGGLGCILAFGDAMSTFFWGLPTTAAVSQGDFQEVEVGTAVPTPPSIRVVEYHADHPEDNPEPVSGVPVTFQVLGSLGQLLQEGLPVDTIGVTTDANGIATLPEGAWVMSGTPGTHQLRASGPFVTGSVDFTAIAVQEAEPRPINTIFTELEYPKGLWIKNGTIYFTETAGRNTSFGGRIRLLRAGPEDSEFEVLLDEPENSDAVVVADDGRIYLTSYKNVSPGDNGDVSVVEFVGEGWQETHLLDIEIASHDMFIDAAQNIYIIGLGNSENAKSLYRLPFPNYAADAEVLRTGLAGARRLTLVGSDIYYATTNPFQVRRLTEDDGEWTDQVFIDGTSVLSLTSDGTYLYYSQFNFGGAPPHSFIRRKHLATGAVQTIAILDVQVNTLRYDAESGTLFFLEAGTVENEFKDGALKAITGLGETPIP